MTVTPIAWTQLQTLTTAELIPGTELSRALEADDWLSDTEPDQLAEFAGRACYKAWDRKNPDTNTNEKYLAHIQQMGHFSVLEHASVTFYVEGVSRALLLELERHRFLSFSVESQRYVDQGKSHPDPVIPPALAGTDIAEALRFEYSIALQHYEMAVAKLLEDSNDLKGAREAARAFLPNATPVDFVVTGNLRCWRDVLGKRWHQAADAEIRGFAGEVLQHLRDIAPNSVQDIPTEPYSYGGN